MSELVAVSRYWTPRHIDVTDAPLRYAQPKPDWLNRLPAARVIVKIDETDRMRRRARHSHTVVNPVEILPLPRIEVDEEEPIPVRAGWRARDLLRRLAYRSV
jgi:hypothetical protein